MFKGEGEGEPLERLDKLDKDRSGMDRLLEGAAGACSLPREVGNGNCDAGIGMGLLMTGLLRISNGSTTTNCGEGFTVTEGRSASLDLCFSVPSKGKL